MTLRDKLEELSKENGRMDTLLNERGNRIQELEDALAEKIYPKESAIEDFESTVLKAIKVLVDRLRKE